MCINALQLLRAELSLVKKFSRIPQTQHRLQSTMPTDHRHQAGDYQQSAISCLNRIRQ
jgi:hypothetical protein